MGQRIRVGRSAAGNYEGMRTVPSDGCDSAGTSGSAARGRRGILCRVVEPGQIRRGDTIEIIQEQKPGTITTGAQEAAKISKVCDVLVAPLSRRRFGNSKNRRLEAGATKARSAEGNAI